MHKYLATILVFFLVGCAGNLGVRNDMTLDEYQERYKDKDIAPGWAAIDETLDSLYPTQEPKHYATTIKYMFGGVIPPKNSGAQK